jgi:hypothetical protein
VIVGDHFMRLSRRAARLACCVALAATAACGEDPTGPSEPVDIQGAFVLILVDGQLVPQDIRPFHIGGSVEITTINFAMIHLMDDGHSCAIRTNVMVEGGETLRLGPTCSYQRSGNTIHFSFVQFGFGTWTGTLRESDSGRQLVIDAGAIGSLFFHAIEPESAGGGDDCIGDMARVRHVWGFPFQGTASGTDASQYVVWDFRDGTGVRQFIFNWGTAIDGCLVTEDLYP